MCLVHRLRHEQGVEGAVLFGGGGVDAQGGEEGVGGVGVLLHHGFGMEEGAARGGVSATAQQQGDNRGAGKQRPQGSPRSEIYRDDRSHNKYFRLSAKLQKNFLTPASFPSGYRERLFSKII
ncbi:MAG: hypothetical protein K2M67_00260 [Muribaculaceae bacterium]|nr:hypothetical protein [Muribaculaceae bacterium]